VTAAQVRDMLGLVDRERVYDLFEAVMAGRIADALDLLRMLYDGGADPVVVIQDLMELTHTVTRMKAAPKAAGANDLGEAERDRGRRLAETLPVPALTRSWQMLAKGLGEVQHATAPIAAAEMVLIRLGYAADLPDPADLVRLLTDGAGGASAPAPARSGAPSATTQTPTAEPSAQARMAPVPEPAPAGALRAEPAPAELDAPPSHVTEGPPLEDEDDGLAPMPSTYQAMVDLFRARGERVLAARLASQVHCVAFAPGRLDIRPKAGVDPAIAAQVGAHLRRWTDLPWDVRVSRDEGEPTLDEQRTSAEQAFHARLAGHPVVAKVLELFPGARIEEVTVPPPEAAPPPDDEETPDDTAAFDVAAHEDRANQA